MFGGGVGSAQRASTRPTDPEEVCVRARDPAHVLTDSWTSTETWALWASETRWGDETGIFLSGVFISSPPIPL